MKDFKNSWEQKEWEFDLASYNRVCNAIKFVEGMKSENGPATMEFYNRSLKKKLELETKYPGLKKP